MLHRLHNTPERYDHRFDHLSDADLEGIDIDYRGDHRVTCLAQALLHERAEHRGEIEQLEVKLEMAKWDGMIDN